MFMCTYMPVYMHAYMPAYMPAYIHDPEDFLNMRKLSVIFQIGRLAQSVKWLVCKGKVSGSNPGKSRKKKEKM